MTLNKPELQLTQAAFRDDDRSPSHCCIYILQGTWSRHVTWIDCVPRFFTPFQVRWDDVRRITTNKKMCWPYYVLEIIIIVEFLHCSRTVWTMKEFKPTVAFASEATDLLWMRPIQTTLINWHTGRKWLPTSDAPMHLHLVQLQKWNILIYRHFDDPLQHGKLQGAASTQLHLIQRYNW